MTSAKVAPVCVAARRNPDTRVIAHAARQTAGSTLLRTTTTLQIIDSAQETSNAIRADFRTQDDVMLEVYKLNPNTSWKGENIVNRYSLKRLWLNQAEGFNAAIDYA